MTDRYLSGFFGDLTAITALGNTVYLASGHAENRHTGLFAINLDENTTMEFHLPINTVAMREKNGRLIVGTVDGKLLSFDCQGHQTQTSGVVSSAAIIDIAWLHDGRIAVVTQQSIVVVNANFKAVQEITLEQPVTAAAVDPGGRWLAIGFKNGEIAVYQCESQKDLQLSDRQPVHRGAVTAMIFEPEELRFFSAGADLKLYLVHARGKLDFEDKGRRFNHGDRINAMALSPPKVENGSLTQKRLVTAGRDKLLKAWPLDSLMQPGSFKDGVGRLVSMCLVQYGDKPHLAAVTDQNAVQVFEFDDQDKIRALSLVHDDVYALAKFVFGKEQADNKIQVLEQLHRIDDSKANQIIIKAIGDSRDTAFRRQAAQLVAQSKHPKTPRLLMKLLRHKDDQVRETIYDGLIAFRGGADYALLQAVISSGLRNIAEKAVLQLKTNAPKDNLALQYLEDALDVEPIEVRTAALDALAQLRGSRVELLQAGMKSKHTDIRLKTLQCFYDQGLLNDGAVQAIFRHSLEDADGQVRRRGFFLSLIGDRKIRRRLADESDIFERAFADIHSEASGAMCEAKQSAMASVLQAMASAYADISLLGAHAMAILGDQRAFGLLLQLSRDTQPGTRRQVCFAFGSLADRRALFRLKTLINDGVLEVRDAAFTAIERLLHEDWESIVDIGLSADNAQVRTRALSVLIRKHKSEGSVWDKQRIYFLRAINDSESSVRQEAFKTLLIHPIADDVDKTLHFLNRSAHPDIRLAVLNETIAQIKEAWTMDRITEGFNDPHVDVRFRAYNYLVEYTDKQHISVFQSALASSYADLRLAAVKQLIALKSDAGQLVLADAIHDDDETIRQTVLQSIVVHGLQAALEKALSSEFDDIRMQAAYALANLGYDSALEPCVDMLLRAEPDSKEGKDRHHRYMHTALQSLELLGAASLFETVVSLLSHKKMDIARHAAKTLVWISRGSHVEALQGLLKHRDTEVKQYLAAALALNGDDSASQWLFGAGNIIISKSLLLAVAMVRWQKDTALFALLDHADAAIRRSALIYIYLMEWVHADEQPDNLLQGLSADHVDVRLLTADALRHYHHSDLFMRFIVDLCAKSDSKKPWQITQDNLRTLAKVLRHHQQPFVKAKFGLLLLHFSEDTQAAWDQDWQLYSRRFADAMAQVAGQQEPSLNLSEQKFAALIFGAYIGLIRDQDADSGLRFAALDKLHALAAPARDSQLALVPVLLQALNDGHHSVRLSAFDKLIQSPLPVQEIYREALSAKYSDVGKRALHWMCEQQSGDAVVDELLHIITRQTTECAIEAFTLALQRHDEAIVVEVALRAQDRKTRDHALNFLEYHFEEKPFARALVLQTLSSRYMQTQLAAALLLARKQDHAAVETLAGLLSNPAFAAKQSAIVKALSQLGAAEGADVLLDFLVNDQQGLADAKMLLDAIAEFRLVQQSARMFDYLRITDNGQAVISALIKISGYDQRIEDPDDRFEDQTWQQEQHPRHDQLLADILEYLAENNDFGRLQKLLGAARWSPSHAVDPVLITLSNQADESMATQIIDVIGWRVKKRQMTPGALIDALDNAPYQFKAAVLLAKAGLPDGFHILMNVVEHGHEPQQRSDAVIALGELADSRALDMLLHLAKDDHTVVQGAAIEALGHMGQSERSDEIFQLLCERLNKSGWQASRALDGLRWFDNEQAWRLIRQTAGSDEGDLRSKALQLLAHNSSDDTKNFLLALIIHDDGDYLQAFATARIVFREGLEPDYALLQRQHAYRMDDSLHRVCSRGETGKILEMLPNCPDSIQNKLTLALLGRENLDATGIIQALAADNANVVKSAAQLAGRQAVTPDLAQALCQSLRIWRQHYWQAAEDKHARHPHPLKEQSDARLALEKLLWACGQHGAGENDVLALCRSLTPCKNELALLTAAMSAGMFWLRMAPVQDVWLVIFRHLSRSTHAQVSELAVDGLLLTVSTEPFDQRAFQFPGSLRKLMVHPSEQTRLQLAQVARSEHYQGVVLPELVKTGDVSALVNIALNSEQKENARLGAVEAMARMADLQAEQKLKDIAVALEQESALCQAAWRAVRRSQRARHKHDKSAASDVDE